MVRLSSRYVGVTSSVADTIRAISNAFTGATNKTNITNVQAKKTKVPSIVFFLKSICFPA